MTCRVGLLLEPHVILDRLYSLDAARKFNRFALIANGVDETAQLDDAFEGFDVDLGRFQRGFIEYGCLDLGGDDGIVDVLSRAFLGGGRCASESRSQRHDEKERSEPLDDKFHDSAPKIMKWILVKLK